VAERRLPQHAVAPLVTLAVGVLCAAVAAGTVGGRGVPSALLATVVVAAFFWSGLVPLLVARVAPESAGLAMIILLTNYGLRLVLALVVLVAATRAGLVDAGAVGLTLIVCALTWTATQVALLTRSGGT